MKAPASETTSAISRLRKTVTRSGRHRFVEEVGFIFLHYGPSTRLTKCQTKSAPISSVQSSRLPHWPACSTRGNARSHPHSMPRGVQEYSGPSLGGLHSSRRADHAKDR